MTIIFREIHLDDIPDCGEIVYSAFLDIAEKHNFEPDFPDSDATTGMLGILHGAPIYDGFVAEEDGKILGSIFVSRGSVVGGISVITVDPTSQNKSVGRSLMNKGMDHLSEQGHARQQLVQAAYHNRSLCLYTKLGFNACDMLSHMVGDPIKGEIPGRNVRQAITNDINACNELCLTVHGYNRSAELAGAIHMGMARVVECDGEISGYNTGVGFVGHGVGKSNDDAKAMICASNEFIGPGIMIPTANGDLFRWCLNNGLRLNQQFTLMDTNPTGSANGAYWPNILC
jgi:GNAT superfamily N-acetyltransferase